MRSFLPPVLVLACVLPACGSNQLFGGKHGSLPSPTNPNNPPAENPEDCSSTNVHRIDRPYVPGQAGAQTFTYSYELIPASAPNAPTVVYIPGGPGQTSIGTGSDWLDKLPDGYGLLLTDPRGVGCNADGVAQYPQAFYRSDYVADDVIAAVGDAKLTNWLVFGISYGTMVSTMTASIAEKGGGPQPTAVVLEGTIGKAMSAGEDSSTYSLLWSADLAQHPGGQAAFANAASLPLGESEQSWEQGIQTSLMLGAIRQGSNAIDIMNTLLTDALATDPGTQAKGKSLLDGFTATSAGDQQVPGFVPFYAYIACQEIWPSVSGFALQNAQLVSVADPNDICRQVGLTLSNPFDSKAWPITAPIYYIQGQNDPATPIAGAVYHATNQTSSTGRMMAIVGAAGHNPFEWSLLDQTSATAVTASKGCYQSLWTAMAAGQSLAGPLAACSWPYGVSLLSYPNGAATMDTVVAATQGSGATTTPTPVTTTTASPQTGAGSGIAGTATSTGLGSGLDVGTSVAVTTPNAPTTAPTTQPSTAPTTVPTSVATGTGTVTGSFPPLPPSSTPSPPTSTTGAGTATSSDTVTATITLPTN